jgi:beta-glucanase (GH16 family)
MKKHKSALWVIPSIGAISMLIYYVGSYSIPCIPTFEEEFNGQTLDASKWSTDFQLNSAGERQYFAPDAFRVWQGNLNIYAEDRTAVGHPYTSGIITTEKTFAQKYGYFVIRAKLPAGKGFWPGFWLLPSGGHYPFEIDVFEMLGRDPYTIYMSSHWGDQQGEHQSQTFSFTSNTSFSTEYHTFAVDWRSTEIKWYVDGDLQFIADQGVPAEPMFMLINLSVGGDWPGYPDESTLFPGIMRLDYVRVYNEACDSIVGSN